MVEQKLFGEDDAAPKRKKKATVPNGAVARLFDRYHKGFLRKWNACAAHNALGCRRCGPDEWALRDADDTHAVKPLYEGGRDAKSLQTLEAQWGEAVVGQVIDEFFLSTDPQITRSDYKVKVFFQHAQRLRLLQQGHGQDQRTIDNIDAARRATRNR